MPRKKKKIAELNTAAWAAEKNSTLHLRHPGYEDAAASWAAAAASYRQAAETARLADLLEKQQRHRRPR